VHVADMCPWQLSQKMVHIPPQHMHKPFNVSLVLTDHSMPPTLEVFAFLQRNAVSMLACHIMLCAHGRCYVLP
jgi:hypothetical protein